MNPNTERPSSSQPIQSRLTPCFTGTECDPDAIAWRILCSDSPQDYCSFCSEERDLAFATKRDCELAIQSLAEAGIVDDEGMEAIDDEELGRLATRYLRW